MTLPEVTYRIINYGSAEYNDALALRRKVLREPLGLSYSEQELASECDDTHLAALENGRVCAYLFLRAEGTGAVKLRQVVVAEGMQGKGVGTGLIRFAEHIASKQHYNECVLHARESAIRFYEKLGYVKEGNAVEMVTLPHWFMRKPLP